MENAPPQARDELRSDFLLAQKTVASGVVPSRDREGQRTWDIWCSFCASINVHPDISTLADFVPVLQAFGLRWRDGRIAPSGDPNRARSVEDAIQLVGQKFSLLGFKDPRLDSTGKQDFRLRRMYSAWEKLDDPPARVEPVPMIILLCAAELCTDCDRNNATIDCIWMAFYFLLHPGEYANASGDAKHPFRLCDVQYKIGHVHIFDAHLTTVQQCLASTFVSLTFSTQNNGVKGEKLAHTPTDHPTSCPVRATLRRVAHLIQHNAPPSTLLHVYLNDAGRTRAVSSPMITSLLCTAALTIPGHSGIDVNNIAARSLRSSGAMSRSHSHPGTLEQ